MEKNVNKILARVRILDMGIELQVWVTAATLNWQSKVCDVGLLVAVLLVNRQWGHYRHHEALQLPVVEVANGLAAASTLPVDATSVFSPTWQLRRCYNPWPFFPILFCIYLLWSVLRRDGTTGEEFIGGPEEAEWSRMESEEQHITPWKCI